MSEQTRVGFLGVGLMGHGMARHILEKGGYPLSILGHRNRAPVEDLVARGATEANDAVSLAAVSDVVFTCLPSAVEMEAVYLGDGGLLAGARPGTIFVDTTTNEPDITRKVGAALEAAGCGLIDAALGRTPKQVDEGQASTYIGGDPATIAKVRPIIETYADTIVICGPLGAGATCKLLNNAISMGMVMMISETFATAAKLDVDLAALSEVLSAGGVNGKMFQMMKPWILHGDDSALRGPLADRLEGHPRPTTRWRKRHPPVAIVASAVSQLYRLANLQGHAEAFMPALPGILAEIAGVKIHDLT